MKSYVIVTPVRNEEKTITQTIESVIRQTILPKEWIIVSDGSTDNTDSIVLQAQTEYKWIKLIQLKPREKPSFAAVVQNTEHGISELSSNDYEYLSLLDADVSFQNNYYETLMDEFIRNPKMGLTGGVAIDIGTPKDSLPLNLREVPGALQFFRRECFESLGGLIAIPEGGWDCVTCAIARMNGYETKLAPNLIVDHLKPRNISQGNQFSRNWQMGLREYATGYHPLFELLKCTTLIKKKPFLIAAVSRFLGYSFATIRKRRRMIPAEVIIFIRSEQKLRLKQTFRLAK